MLAPGFFGLFHLQTLPRNKAWCTCIPCAPCPHRSHLACPPALPCAQVLSFIQQAVSNRDISQLQQVVQQVTSWVAHARSHPNTWPDAMEKQASPNAGL